MVQMIPITQARRNLGALVKRLEKEKEISLVKDGKVVAKLSLPEEERQKRWIKALDNVRGAWKGTDLDDNKLWEDIIVNERIKGTKKTRVRL